MGVSLGKILNLPLKMVANATHCWSGSLCQIWLTPWSLVTFTPDSVSCGREGAVGNKSEDMCPQEHGP